MYPGSNVLGGTPLIRVSDVKNGAIAKKPDFCISSEVDQEYRRTKLFGSELLITLVGNPGDCVIVTEEMIGWNAARALAVLKLKDPDLRRWLRYVLLSKPAKHLIDARLNTTVQKTLNLKDIRELGVPIPPKEERYKITNVIDAIENKMLLNTQTNQTLESIAQAIFKSWFVDFEPVKAKMATLAEGGTREQAELAAMGAISGKSEAELAQLQQQNPEHYQQLAETAALFPSAMVESELGEIPDGWEVKTLSEMINIIGGGTPNRSIQEYWNGDIPWFSIKDLPNPSDVFVIDTDEKITELGLKKSSTKLLPANTTIITARGTVGKLALIDKPMCMNQSCYGITGANGIEPIFNYFNLKEAISTLQRNTHGAVFDTITTKTFDSYTSAFSGNSLAKSFDHTTRPLLEKIKCNLYQIKYLAEIRDSLLPKLLSGEIDLSDIQSEVA